MKLLYLGILYRFISGKNILSKNLCRFIKGVQKLEPILSLYRCKKNFSLFFLWLHRCRKTFSWFFLSCHRCRKTCFRFFLSLHRSRKTLFGVFYRFIGEKNSAQQNCIALFDFFSKIVYRYCFNRYIFEYRCPPLYNGRD